MGTIISHHLTNLRAGEDDVLRALEEGTPSSWQLACNLVIPDGDDGRELDVVAIGHTGIYVLEVKNSGGYITINNRAMTSNNHERGNPCYQVDGAAKALASHLRRKLPEFGQYRKPVHGHIVLSNSQARVTRVDDEIEHQVSTLPAVVDDLMARDKDSRKRQSLDEGLRVRIANQLSAAETRTEVPDRIGSYSIQEVLSSSASSRSYAAIHDDGTQVVLRVLRPKNTLDQTYAEREREGLLREYEALRQLSALDVCPAVQQYWEWESGEYVIPIEAVEGRSLWQEITGGVAPDGDRVREVVSAAYRALAIVHESDPVVVHRAITPERVIVTPNGTVKFTGFQVAHIDERTGLTSVLADIDPDDEQEQYWRAPETKRDLAYATTASDVWALATTLKAWVIGSTKSGDLKKDTLPGEARHRLGPVSKSFSNLLRAARADGARPSAREVADDWSDELEGGVQEAQREGSDEPDESAAPLPLCRRELEPGTVLLDRYELIEQLGSGGTATTYFVHDLHVDEQVVLKSFDFDRVPESLALQEFKKAKSLVHERIATVREFHPPGHPFHLVIDFVPGVEAAQLDDRFVGDTSSVTAVAESLLEALAYIHDKGYLHRDVSPRNVIVDPSDPGSLRLIDFGLAALKTDSSQGPMGTFGYVAPEIVSGGDWSPAADVYSAGVLLYELLTGEKPFAMAPAPLHHELKDPPESTDPDFQRFARFLLTAVQVDPADRFPDAGEFLAALHEALDDHADDLLRAPGADTGPPEVPADDEIAGSGASSWMTGYDSLEDAHATAREVEGGGHELAPARPTLDRVQADVSSVLRPVLASEEAVGEQTQWELDASEPLAVEWRPDGAMRFRGNASLGVGRIRKYALGLDGTVRGVLPGGGRERTVYARAPRDFVDIVNAAKSAGGQTAGGSLVIDHSGNVLVGTGAGIFLAGRVSGFLRFEDGSNLLTARPGPELRPGDVWTGLRVGLRYKLNASTTDVAYESATGGWVWLSEAVGARTAREIAGRFGEVKAGGGRLYVNEAGAVFAPLQVGQEWREIYLGLIDPTNWFPDTL